MSDGGGLTHRYAARLSWTGSTRDGYHAYPRAHAARARIDVLHYAAT